MFFSGLFWISHNKNKKQKAKRTATTPVPFSQKKKKKNLETTLNIDTYIYRYTHIFFRAFGFCAIDFFLIEKERAPVNLSMSLLRPIATKKIDPWNTSTGSDKPADTTSLFLIVAGMTGAGKSSLVRHVLTECLNMDESHLSRLHRAVIDDLVENDRRYLQKTQVILKKMQKEADAEYSGSLDSLVSSPSAAEKYAQQFSAAYFSVRKNSSTKPNYDVQNDTALRQALLDRKGILFEFVGNYFPEWLVSGERGAEFLGCGPWPPTATVKPETKRNGTKKTSPPCASYQVVFAVSLVDICSNIQRMKERFLKTVEANRRPGEPQKGARLPKLETFFVTRTLLQILKTIRTLLSQILAGRPVRLVVVDNRSETMRTVLDTGRHFVEPRGKDGCTAAVQNAKTGWEAYAEMEDILSLHSMSCVFDQPEQQHQQKQTTNTSKTTGRTGRTGTSKKKKERKKNSSKINKNKKKNNNSKNNSSKSNSNKNNISKNNSIKNNPKKK